MADIVYLSMGSNVGDRVENLREAMRRFEGASITLRRTSSIYETEPVDNTNQSWFLNCVAEVNTALEPIHLLHKLRRIEMELGRERTVPKGPRTLDIDILIYGDLVLESDELTLPHPRMLERRFVLQPLNEIAPTLVIPSRWSGTESGAGKTVHEALNELRDPAQVRLLMKALCARAIFEQSRMRGR